LFSRKIIFLVLIHSVPSFTTPTWAAISPLKIKGIHSALKEEYRYASPLYGSLSLISQLKTLRFHGNYGKKKDPYPCLESQYSNRNDCPQDHTAAFIQMLFPSPDHVSLVPNQNASHPIKDFKASTFGKLWAAILQIRESTLVAENLRLQWIESTILDILIDLNPNLISKTNNMTNLEESIERAHNQIQDLRGKELDGNTATKIQELEKKLKENKNKLSGLNKSKRASFIEKMKSGKKWKTIEQFVSSAVGAYLENLPSLPKYEAHLVERTLGAFVMLKFDEKSDVRNFLTQAPFAIALDKQDLFSENGAKEWDADNYSVQDYIKLKNTFGLSHLNNNNNLSNIGLSKEKIRPFISLESAKEMSRDLETLTFMLLMADFVDSNTPPVLTYKYATHPSLGNKETYSDCGDTMIRNFSNFVAYDPDQLKFDTEKLPDSAITSKEFYKNNPSVFEMFGSKARNDWSEKVVSGLSHPPVNYIHPSGPGKTAVCGINAGLQNTIAVLENLLNDNILREKSSNLEKLDRICEVLSLGPKFKLNWNIIQGTREDIEAGKPGVEIAFVSNYGTGIRWKIQKNHYVGLPHSFRKNDWRISAAEVTTQNLINDIKLIKEFPHLRYFLSWNPYKEAFSDILANQEIQAAQELLPSLFLSLELYNPNQRADAFRQIMITQKADYYPVALNLIQDLAEEKNWIQITKPIILQGLSNRIQTSDYEPELQDSLELWSKLDTQLEVSPFWEVIYDSAVRNRHEFCSKICAEIHAENFSGSKSLNASFRGKNLACSSFVGANVSRSDFTNSNLTCTDFSDAKMEGINLTGANIIGINLSRAKLKGAFSDYVPVSNSKVNDHRKSKKIPFHFAIRSNLTHFEELYLLGDDLEKVELKKETTLIVPGLGYSSAFNAGIDHFFDGTNELRYDSY
jgi:hypothetical protein